MIDSSDSDRFDDAVEEFEKLINEPELSSALFIVFANKQDLPNA